MIWNENYGSYQTFGHHSLMQLNRKYPRRAILKGFTYDESYLSSGDINGDTPRLFDPVKNDLCSPRISPLHTAAKRGHVKIVRLLVEHDADCNIQDDDGQTPLIHATVGGYEEVAGLLLSYGASVQIADHRSRSALHWALMGRRDRLLRNFQSVCVVSYEISPGKQRFRKSLGHHTSRGRKHGCEAAMFPALCQ